MPRMVTATGRFGSGEAHWNKKLSDADIQAIRESCANGLTHKEIATQFSVHQSTVSRILAGLRRVKISSTAPPYFIVDKPCSVDGCERNAMAKTFCQMHYQRWRTHGDPLFTTRGGR